MIFDKVNIAEVLKTERDKSNDLLEETNTLLNNSAQKDIEIVNRLKGNSSESKLLFELSDIDKEKIFSINEIEKICITYRLRFLDSKYFKQDIPNEAVSKINKFEERYKFKINNFKIIAPSSVFELQDVNQDPLLFAQLSDSKYYLIHKWGNDLAWYRKFLYLPIRSIYTYFYSVIIAATIFSFSIPFSWLQVTRDNEIYIRVWFTVHCTIGFFFFILFIGAVSQASFNSMSWKSKFYNE